jgi:hypothetical protein
MNKKWSDYLTDPAEIARQVNRSNRAVWYWIENNKVPERFFARLEPILAKLGHKLTPTQMREINDDNKP